MKIPLLVSIALIIIYLVVYILKYGIPATFSATYRKMKVWFTIVVTIFGFSISIAGSSVLFFFSGALLVLVGVARRYWDPGEATLHYIGAIGSLVLGMAGLIVYYQSYRVVVAYATVFLALEILPLVFPKTEIKNHNFYIELIGFLILATCLLI